MIKLGELAPAVAARVAADEAHRRACRAPRCALCGRDPSPAQDARAAVLARLPEAFAEATLEARWLAAKVGATTIADARATVASWPPRVAFLGPKPGAGKTSLAIAMFRLAVRRETDAARIERYVYASSFELAKARPGHALGDGEALGVEQALNASLLLLDELGGEDPRGASAVAEVVFERHARKRPTWVTTGFEFETIAQRYGGGIARRVFEEGKVFRLGGPR